MSQGLRFSRLVLRAFIKQPLFAVLTVVSLALGIGVNAAIFSVVNAVLIRPLPYTGTDRLCVINSTGAEGQPNQRSARGASRFEFFYWLENARSFSGLGAVGGFGPQYVTRPVYREIVSKSVSPGFFGNLGLHGMQGRVFAPDELGTAAQRVAIISDQFRKQLPGWHSVIGRNIELDGEVHTIIGILPPGFQLLYRDVDVWVPLTRYQVSPSGRHRAHDLMVVGRLKDGVTLRQAQTEMEAIQNSIIDPFETAGKGALVESLQDFYLRNRFGAGEIRMGLLILVAVSALVFVACSCNVSNLVLGHALRRQREMAVRIALGAGKGTVFQFFLIEGLILGCAGGLVGVLLSYWGHHALLLYSPYELNRFSSAIDSSVVAFSFALSIGCGLLMGLGPAVLCSSQKLARALNQSVQGAPGRSRIRFARFLAVLQTSLALIVVIGMGLLLNSLIRLSQVDPGFDPENLLIAQLEVPETKYSLILPQDDGERTIVRPRLRSDLQELAQKLQMVPGVSVVAIADYMQSGSAFRFHFEGANDSSSALPLGCRFRPVSENYFKTMRIPLLRGRQFQASDTEASPPVAILDTLTYRSMWPDGNPLGLRVVLERFNTSYEVIGLVGNIRENKLDEKADCTIYIPFIQQPEEYTNSFRLRPTIVLRTVDSAERWIPSIRPVAFEIFPEDQSILHLTTMEDIFSEGLAERRFSLVVLGGFGIVSTLLAVSGVYAVAALLTKQRLHEFGIRLVLGSSTPAIVGLVMKSGLAVAGSGVAIGLWGASSLTGYLTNQLYGVDALDPMTFTIAAAFLLGTSLLAFWFPARQAGNVDPLKLLRYE